MTEGTRGNVAPSGASSSRRWKRLTPLLLVVVGFGAGVLASHLAVPRLLHRGGEHRVSRREGADRRATRPGGERSERGRLSRRDARDSEVRVRRFREQLVDRLALDEAQQAQMDAFIEANRAEASAFWDDTYVRYRELRLQFREQIREILDESQRETFEAWMDERRRNGRGRDAVEGGPGGGASR